MKKAVLIGDYKAIYHPLGDIEKEIIDIFKSNLDITVKQDYENLEYDELIKYDVLIDYIDKWSEKGSDRLAADIISFVACGGSLLSIHNGIIKWGNYELEALYGGSFIIHPPYTYLSFKADSHHHIAKEIKELEFYLEEEPYEFKIDAFMKKDVFLTYKFGEANKPAGWTRNFAKGKVVYIAPGHNVITFKNEAYRKLLLQCGKWLCR